MPEYKVNLFELERICAHIDYVRDWLTAEWLFLNNDVEVVLEIENHSSGFQKNADDFYQLRDEINNVFEKMDEISTDIKQRKKSIEDALYVKYESNSDK